MRQGQQVARDGGLCGCEVGRALRIGGAQIGALPLRQQHALPPTERDTGVGEERVAADGHLRHAAQEVPLAQAQQRGQAAQLLGQLRTQLGLQGRNLGLTE